MVNFSDYSVLHARLHGFHLQIKNFVVPVQESVRCRGLQRCQLGLAEQIRVFQLADDFCYLQKGPVERNVRILVSDEILPGEKKRDGRERMDLRMHQ